MKVFLIAALIGLSSFASDEFFLKAVHKTSFYTYDLEFEANPELGRAWVKITTNDNDPDGYSDEERVKIPGLRYEDGEVLFEKDGKVVVCAVNTVSGRWIFKHESLKETGHCLFEEEDRVVSIDDGFYVRQTKKTFMKLVIL